MKVRITREEYQKITTINQRIDEAYDLGADQKYLFSMRNLFPTIEELKAHKVEENLEKYLPYLLFYYKRRIRTKDPEYAKSMAFLRDLLKKNVRFSKEEEKRQD